jgi:hypothetical protein
MSTKKGKINQKDNNDRIYKLLAHIQGIHTDDAKRPSTSASISATT